MDPVSAIANALGSILPGLGIGSKSRINETNAMGAVQAELAVINSKNTIKIVAISGVLILVIAAIILTLRRR